MTTDLGRLCSWRNYRGGTLKKHVLMDYPERKKLVLYQMLRGLSYLHSRGVVHRDLKPENLLLENGGGSSIIKVIDFGTSQVFNPDEKMKSKFGTPYYIAPEVLRGCYDSKCDMWSCGVILYVLLSGKPPFDGDNDI